MFIERHKIFLKIILCSDILIASSNYLVSRERLVNEFSLSIENKKQFRSIVIVSKCIKI